ncbi:MAG: M3 family metallopeptidase, partial [Burkholderiales bacterium]
MNPLLDFSGLPRFADFKPEFVEPAVSQLLGEVAAAVDEVTAGEERPTWDSLVTPLDDAIERLRRAWGQVAHLNAVMNSPQLREVYNANLPKVTQMFTELAQNESLFQRYKALKASPEFEELDDAQRKFIDNELRDFRLGGADLSPEKKAEFRENAQQLAGASSRFNDNLLDETNAFELIVTDKDDLSGIPADVIDAAARNAEGDGKKGWKFTLHAPSYLPVMQYADNRSLREKMYRGFVTRASEFGAAEHDNTQLINEILRLRRRQAQLLGYQDYAEVSLEPKMAQSPRQVLDFLQDFAARAKPHAKRDLDTLREFAASEMGMDTLEAWDVAYASEKLRVARYAFSDQEVKQYFPEPKVLEGMFRVVQTIYGIRIVEADAPRWHQDVRFYSIYDRDEVLVGQFYLDLYARSSKRGGAWMDDAITRRRKKSRIQTPVAYLNCNFSSPIGDKPALLTHDEVITLFHEFGHGLHH